MEVDVCIQEHTATETVGSSKGAHVVIVGPRADHFRFNRATLLLLKRPPALGWARWCELQGVCFEVVNHH